MRTLDSVRLKVKGKVQQVQGDMQIRSGRKLEGVGNKIKGKINETISDLKIR
jgi:uncharacterized protein YjbJ (UPF0337 family)